MAGKPDSISAAILAGGLGTRLRPLTLRVPKPLVKVAGKPFLGYLLSQIKSMGIRKCLLLTGYKHSAVKNYCKNGEKWGIKIEYSRERMPSGTGGALFLARKKIKSTTLVLNGDSWLEIDLPNFLSFHKKSKAWVTILSMRGSLKARGALVIGKDGKVKEFLEKQKGGFGIFNTGAYLIEPQALGFLASKIKSKKLPAKFSMEHEGFPLFAKEGKLYSYVAKGKFLDIGTFSSLLLAHKILPGRKKERKGAIFLDRDGVINKQKEGYVLHPEDFEFELGAIDGMKKMARLGMPLIIVTNQSVIGRGLSTLAILKKIHGKMLSGLRKHGIRIDSIFFCPHKPDESCGCRKPKIGMLVAAQEKHNLDLSKSFVIGDSTSDILMGKAAGCTTILVRTGYGGKDKLHKVKPDYICKDLPDAASIIARIVKRSKFGFS